MLLYRYKVVNSFEYLSQNQNVLANCLAISFTNIGTTKMKVYEREILPGQSIYFDTNDIEAQDVSIYPITFEGGKGKCEVLRRVKQNVD